VTVAQEKWNMESEGRKGRFGRVDSLENKTIFCRLDMELVPDLG